jgi:hypothetical protein
MSNEKEEVMLNRISVDESPHNRDGLVLHAEDDGKPVEAFISRKVMDLWVEPHAGLGRHRSLYRAEYNELGKRNLDAVARIVARKYGGGITMNRQHPYVEVLTSDIIESGEVIDQHELVRAPLPPAFNRV